MGLNIERIQQLKSNENRGIYKKNYENPFSAHDKVLQVKFTNSRCATRNFSGQARIFLGHFDKHFIKKKQGKKGSVGNILESFHLETPKSTFFMENLTQRWTLSGPFYQNQGNFFNFQKRAGEACPLSPIVARL